MSKQQKVQRILVDLYYSGGAHSVAVLHLYYGMTTMGLVTWAVNNLTGC